MHQAVRLEWSVVLGKDGFGDVAFLLPAILKQAPPFVRVLDIFFRILRITLSGFLLFAAHRQADLLLEGDALLHPASFGANSIKATFAVVCEESTICTEGGKICKSGLASITLVNIFGSLLQEASNFVICFTATLIHCAAPIAHVTQKYET